MSAFVANITGGGFEASILACPVEENGVRSNPPPGANVVGRDASASETGWAHVEARRVSSSATEVDLWVPYYQPTVFVAASTSPTELAIGLEQTILVVAVSANGDVTVSYYGILSPVQALVALDDAFVVIHGAGADRISPDGLRPEATGGIVQWRLVDGDIRFSMG